MNLLGWMQAPEQSLEQWDDHVALAAAARRDGLTRTLVCGMGGSSLVAAVLAETFGVRDLEVLDSTNPLAVRDAAGDNEVARTLFIVASKSGNTIETLAFCQHFLTRAGGGQFVAITETGSPLDTLARERRFRAIIPHPPGVGGRYSALTAIGMLPAALGGIDGRALLERTQTVDVDVARARGVAIAEAALGGRDKLNLVPPASVSALAHWIEQLVAESSGKDGRGIVPVVQDPAAASLSDVQTVSDGDFSPDPLDIGAEFLRWEYATAALCERLGVNAFDQPDVEEAKVLARAELSGGPGPQTPSLPTLSLEQLRRRARPKDYFAVLAYVPPRANVLQRLQVLRRHWGRALGCVTTLGIGPRYLHSTGQLHKGGPNTGLFLIITTDVNEDVEIPGMGRTFGELHRAQARGDVRALLTRGRRVAHVHLSSLDEIDQLQP